MQRFRHVTGFYRNVKEQGDPIGLHGGLIRLQKEIGADRRPLPRAGWGVFTESSICIWVWIILRSTLHL